MNRKIIVIALVLLGIVLVSGCTEPLDEEAGAVKDSAGEWLKTGYGAGKFPGGTAGDPLRVWKGGEVLYWIVPIINADGLYAGSLLTVNASFTFPNQITQYREPRERFINMTQSEAYQKMIMDNPKYPAYQIEKPVLVAVEEKGMFWYSRVRANDEVIDELYVATSV